MTQTWRDVFDRLDVPLDPTSSPEGESGAWAQGVTRFTRTGFLRSVVTDADADGLRAVVQFALPGASEDALGRVEAALEDAAGAREWSRRDEEAQTVFSGPVGADEVEPFIITLLKLSDLLAAVAEGADLDAAIAELAPTDEAGEETASPAPSQDAFETIGEATAEAPLDEEGAVYRDVRVVDEALHLAFGLSAAVDADTRERLEAVLSRNLRAKIDVDASPLDAAASQARLPAAAATAVYLKLVPQAIVRDVAAVGDVVEPVRDYLSTIAELADSGVDPLVFLGVRESSRGPSPRSTFEDIGAGPADADAVAEPAEPPIALTLEDEGPEERGAPTATTGLILDLSGGGPADGEPLEAGGFDDARLSRPDATTALVDVVLRHPGYADRRIAQVLSILLSLEYYDALQLADAAPTVIAWGVARDRGQTFKTVVEGAGGKIVLVEPGTFPER